MNKHIGSSFDEFLDEENLFAVIFPRFNGHFPLQFTLQIQTQLAFYSQ